MTATEGWYDDGTGKLRWWDGSAWGPHAPAQPSKLGRPARSSVQRVWTFAFWLAAAWCTYGLVLVVIWPAENASAAAVSVILGAIACIVGALGASSIRRLHLSDQEFVKGTTTIRAIAVTWLLIMVLAFASAILQADFVADVAESAAAELIGPASLVALAGPGYSELRGARSHALT